MGFLELIAVWVGASGLLLGFLKYCDYQTQREIRKQQIIRQVNGDARSF